MHVVLLGVMRTNGQKGGSMDDLISRQEVIRLILERGLYCDTQADREISAEIIRQLPSAQPETHEERTETHACDCISRQSAIEVIDAVFPVDPMKSEYAQGIACGAALAKTYVEQLPSAQQEIKPIEYRDCANAMLRMWIDNVVTDGEYNRIMDKLNAHWGTKNE